MALLDRFKKKTDDAAQAKQKAATDDKKAAAPAQGAKKTKKDAPAKKADKKAAPAAAFGGKTVLVRPIITEKATLTGTYIFEVARDANKPEIKKAIQKIYGVTPATVRIMNISGKKVRWGRTTGTQRSWKKAIVRLNAGETINVYEGL